MDSQAGRSSNRFGHSIAGCEAFLESQSCIESKIMNRLIVFPLVFAAALSIGRVSATSVTTSSPDRAIQITVNDDGGLSYAVTMDHKPVIVTSHLGLSFEGGWSIGPQAQITNSSAMHHDSINQNLFGKRRFVRDNYNETTINIAESGPTPRQYGLIVRAYNDSVAFRYVLPKALGIDSFVITDEATQFVFPHDVTCWGGDYSNCTECQYPQRPLSQLTTSTGTPSCLPLLTQVDGGYAAISEADLIDWAGMFLIRTPSLEGTQTVTLKADLATRQDGHGMVISSTPCVSPWRVVLLGRKPGDLYASDTIWNLATPSQLSDFSWVKSGITAWDPWWSGTTGTRGTTETDRPYIDFASSMDFPYDLIDWGWYQGSDTTTIGGSVDVLGLRDYAATKNVKLLLWLNSNDLKSTGVDKTFAKIASWGIPGVKIDFMNSDSQETVEWYYSTLQSAAKYHLMVDFHGAYKPTGLARTWPNFITQEGVMGNEYNKLRGDGTTIKHTATLPFTRAILGPMDFTPGGFVNVTKAEFVQDDAERPGGTCEVLGTRAHQLAETVIYPSPLLCLCDNPKNYVGQTGVEFFRGLPTVWDDTSVLDADVANYIVVARKSGDRWYLAALGGDSPLTLTEKLSFLPKGKWTMDSYHDTPDSETTPTSVAHTLSNVTNRGSLSIPLATGGGFVAILTRN